MKKNRRRFLRISGLAGLAGGTLLNSFASPPGKQDMSSSIPININPEHSSKQSKAEEGDVSLIGLYGPWAASLQQNNLPAFSFRRKEWSELKTWHKSAKARFTERLAMPDLGGLPEVKVSKTYSYDGLQIEELSWQLPYGRPTEAILLKPQDAKGPLPAILALHDHGGNKYFGKRKITRTSDQQHPLMEDHQQHYYENLAWANEIAKRGYVVLVPDAFPFASRRVMMQDVPEHLRKGLDDTTPEKPDHIEAYNRWAGEHEHIMAKSLFSAGTTWPAVFLAEDLKALDILCARDDVDEQQVGCGGLSGGGMRTVFLGGFDPRIKCAVCVGFMTTWNDFVLNKSYTHTWMTYVPLLPNELEFPEILGLRVPLPTLVLNDEDDQLYTLPEMKKADKILKDVYEKADAADHYQCSYYPGLHKFDAKMQEEAFDWFDRWLKN
ncbi:dienelactone hydrolase [Catalinimonas alkaloidigena]|uniref:alpha/beta hydrolase family protein n=1 Tax=Catalinimonas alkaloidigena TaxID=1075417 RepID=UPI0024063BC4|nr:alpha/beta hydrolase family protein [Catalinimonas alkaloidigena]MDF9797576.1 dienelactone hydrolase [Catalinimonas alkaloidigena]